MSFQVFDKYGRLRRKVGSGHLGEPVQGPWQDFVKPPPESAFSWTNQGGATYTRLRNGAVYLHAPATAGNNIRVLTRSVPSGGTWTKTFCLAQVFPVVSGAETPLAGLCLRESATGKLILFVLFNASDGSLGLVVSRWDSPTAYNADQKSTLGEFLLPGPALWFRLADNGTSHVYSVSSDGINFIEFSSAARAAFFTTNADQVGYALSSEQATYPVGLTVFSEE